MKSKKKFNRLIAVVSIFALMFGTAIPTVTWLANKTNASIDLTNAVERGSNESYTESIGNAFPITFGGSGVSEDVSGLAFKFDIEVKGLAVKDGNKANYKNASVVVEGKTYKLLSMGAVAHNREAGRYYEISECNGTSVINVPAVYLFNTDSANNEASFAVRITGIPKTKYNASITAIPYVTVEVNGVSQTIYGDVRVRSINKILDPEAWQCENGCFGWSGTEDNFSIWRIEEDGTTGEGIGHSISAGSSSSTSSSTGNSSGSNSSWSEGSSIGSGSSSSTGNSSGSNSSWSEGSNVSSGSSTSSSSTSLTPAPGGGGVSSGSSSSSSSTIESDIVIDEDWVTVKYVNGKLKGYVKCKHGTKVHEFVIPEE